MIILNVLFGNLTEEKYKQEIASQLKNSQGDECKLKNEQLIELIELSMSGENIVMLTQQAHQ